MHRATASRLPKATTLVLACLALAAPLVRGQTYNWNNFSVYPGTSNPTQLATLWTIPTNWDTAPVFGQNAVLSFGSSTLLAAGSYATTNEGDNTINSLVFSLEGNSQGFNAGTPLVFNASSANPGTIRFTPNSTAVAPSILQNGSGSVWIRPGLTGGNFAIEGTAPLSIGGTGIGLVQLDAFISPGSNMALNPGLLINFAPSAVAANNTGASVALGGTNTFTGNVTLQNGNLAIGSATALGAATNSLVIAPGSNSVRFSTNVAIANPVVLNSTLNFTSYDGATATWTGAWSGTGGLSLRAGVGSTFNLQGPAAFGGPLIVRPLSNGQAGTANNQVLTIGSSTGGATNGSLTTTDLQLFPGSFVTLSNTAANATRLAPNTNLTIYRSTFSLVANATAGSNAAETLSNLTNTGMSTFFATPQTATSATLTFASWTRLSNSTAYFVGTGLGGAPGANVGNIVFTANPGGATAGSSTAGTQNLAVLPYAYANSASTGNFLTSLARYDSGTGRITPLNTTTEYASNQTLANGGAAAGLNYRLAGAGTGGVVNLNAPVTLNGLVIDSNTASPNPPVGLALTGTAAVTVTGPILSTFSGNGFPTGINALLPNQIAVGSLNFGANTAYFHTPGDLWVLNPITGTGGLVKSGENGGGQSNLYLLGNNPFTGGLTINAGLVQFDSDANLGAAGVGILMNSAGNGGLNYTPNVYYGAVQPTATAFTLSRTLTLGAAGGSLTSANTNGTLTVGGLVTGTGALTISTVGPVVLNNASNNFVGDLFLRSGTLVAASDAALGAAGNRVVMGVPFAQAVFQANSGFTSTNRDFLILNSGNSIFTNNVNLTINGTLASTQTNNAGPGITKGGLGTLTLTATNTLGGPIVVGDTGIRIATSTQAQIGGALRLTSAAGSLAIASGFTVNDGASLILDNSAGVNNDRVGTVSVGLGGGALTLIGNGSASVNEAVGMISSLGTITLTQPIGASPQSTNLFATGLSAGANGALFVRGTNFGATSGNRTSLTVTPLVATSLPVANGIVVGAVSAASDTSAPTDFLAATTITVNAPNLNQMSLAPLATYGSLASAGATVNASQAGSVFTLAGATDLNALRIGAGGGVNLSGQTLTLGTTTSNERAGMILATGANPGIVGGTIDFQGQVPRVVAASNLSIGTSANPVALLGTTGTFIKSGAGTLPPSSAASATTVSGAVSSGLTVAEGTLVLGNANALGRATLNPTAVAPIPNVYAFTAVMRGATLDLSQLSGSPIRVNTTAGAGNFVLGDTTLNTGTSSSNIAGNITGSALSRYIVGLAQTELPLNTFGGGGPTLSGDNTGFLGQWQVLRGTLRFSSNLSFGTGTSPILLGDTATPTAVGSASINIDSTVSVPFPRDIIVQAGNFALPGLLVGNTGNQTMTGSLTLNKALGITGNVGGNGVFTFAGVISGPGQLQLLNSGLSSASGNIAIAGANPNWSGGVLMTNGSTSSGISSILAVGADNSLGTGTLTIAAFAGLLRADNGPRTLANAIDVAPISPFTANFGTTGVNDITLNGNVRGVLAAVLAAPSTMTLVANSISQGATTFNGNIANGAAFNLGITKNGPGLVALNAANAYTGDTVVNAGTLRLGNANALGFGGRQAMTAVAGAATVNSGAILDLNGQTNVNKPIVLAGGSLLNSGAAASIAGGTVSSFTISNLGGVQSAVPVVNLAGGGGTGAAAIASLGLTQASLTFAAATDGGGGYTATPTVSVTGGGGTGATAVATLGVTAQTFTILNGGSGYVTAPTPTISGSGTSGAVTATATSSIVGGVVTSITIVNPGTGYNFTPTIAFAAAPSGGTTATGIGNAVNFRVGGVTLTNPGGGYSSAPTVAFVGGTTGTAGTVVANATNFAVGLVVANPGSGYTSAPAATFGATTIAATVNLSSVSVTATSSVGGSGDLTINAPISGVGGLIKVGTGILNLTGANTYSGGTTVGLGTLRANNAAGSSGTGTGAVSVVGTGTVGSGGTLGGVGFIGGAVTIGGTATTLGGKLAPGNSIGTLTQTSGSMTWSPGGQYDFEHDVSTSTGDLANGTGTATLNLSGLGTGAGQRFAFNLSAFSGFGAASAMPLTYTVATYAGGVTAPSGIVGNDLTPFFAFSGQFLTTPTATLSGTSVLIGFQPVPEPTSILALVAGTAGAFGWMRRRRGR